MSVKEEWYKVPVARKRCYAKKAMWIRNIIILPCNDGNDCMLSQPTRLEKCEHILFFLRLTFFSVRYSKSLWINFILSCWQINGKWSYLKAFKGIIRDFSAICFGNGLDNLHSSGYLPLWDEPTNWFEDTAVMVWWLLMRDSHCPQVIGWNIIKYKGVMKISATGDALMRKKGFQSPSAFNIQGSTQPAMVWPTAIMMFAIRLLLLTSTYSNAETWIS